MHERSSPSSSVSKPVSEIERALKRPPHARAVTCGVIRAATAVIRRHEADRQRYGPAVTRTSTCAEKLMILAAIPG